MNYVVIIIIILLASFLLYFTTYGSKEYKRNEEKIVKRIMSAIEGIDNIEDIKNNEVVRIELKQLLQDKKKISAIRVFKTISGADLNETKSFLDTL